GLTVVRELARRLPEESVVYFGDTARLPYGNRSPEEIVAFGREISRFLLDQGVKMIVVACNTSSALALPVLAAEIPVPMVEVLTAGAMAAVEGTRTGRIGVLATEAPARSGAYERAIRSLLPTAEVTTVGCPALVPMVEAGIVEGEEVRKALDAYLAPLRERRIDTLVYGCTHYPFLDPVVAEMLHPEVVRVDPAVAVVDRVIEILRDLGALVPARTSPDRFVVSGSPERFRALGSFFLGRTLPPVEKVCLEDYGMAELPAQEKRGGG
ncbi:MAG: glutamate racemase, partial [Firmicutes bacterium]|nr:glutamate racemase [Bacillota bacterium]